MNFIRIKDNIINLDMVESVTINDQMLTFTFPNHRNITVTIQDVTDAGINRKFSAFANVALPEKEEKPEAKENTEVENEKMEGPVEGGGSKASGPLSE